MWDFTLANYDAVWAFMVQIGLLLIFLLIGNLLRTVVPFFRQCLIPSALIGGGLLCLVDIISTQFGYPLVDNQVMQVITYHALGIGFAAMTLKTEKKTMNADKAQVFEFGALQGGTYMLQAFLGLGITILLFLLTKGQDGEISYISGLLLPLGFGQGPGNALTWDINFSNMEATGFTGNGSVGLSLASIGFIVASVFGIIYINIYKKRGTLHVREMEKSNTVQVVETEGDNEIPDSESVDKFSIQMGFVALAYAIAFGIMCLLGAISDF
ncbi:MAG: hypothetical protein IJW96_01665, partial [Clostridia bacterium]|nr:hypothetical protein [Clostridia bacterium]